MNGLWQDLRYALRQLSTNPGFTAVAVLTLALGIGANTAIFSIMNADLLRYLPVPNPQQIVLLQTDSLPQEAEMSGINSDRGSLSFNLASFEQLRTDHHVFSDLMAFVPLAVDPIPVRFGKEAEEATGYMVSGNFFTGLGVRAERGRTFTLRDEAEHSQSVVLSYNYWTQRLNRDPSVMGQTMYIKSVPFTVVGIAGRDFAGMAMAFFNGKAPDFWIPFQTDSRLKPWGQASGDNSHSLYGSPNWWFLALIGRLQPGMPWKNAAAQLNPQFQGAAYEGIGSPSAGERLPQLSFSATGGIEKLRESGQSQFRIPMAMAALVLLIACLNVTMLLLARNASRQRDFSLRVALGAGRRQLFRQLFAEAMLLTSAGALLAWIVALWTAPILASWAKLDISVAPDQTVLVFMLIIAVVITLMLALAPLPTIGRAKVGLMLKPSGVFGSESRSKFRSGQLMVALQISMCLVLLVGTGLLVRSLLKLQTTDLGLRASGILVFGITPPQTLHTQNENLIFYQSLIAQLRALPDVESATVMSNRIGSGVMSGGSGVKVDGATPPEDSGVNFNNIGADYFHVLDIPLLQGREFNDADSAASAKVAVINKTFANRYLPGRNPIGHQIQLPWAQIGPVTIIGVAADSKYTTVRDETVPTFYVPYSPGGLEMTIALRAYGAPLNLSPEVRRVVAGFSPDMALFQPTTLKAQFEDSYSGDRLFAEIALLFGLLASALVATGLYGTLAYKVNRRMAEIGIRMALGAQRREVLWMVVRESLLVSSAGLSLGFPLAFLAVRLLRSMLYQLSPFDPVSFVLATCGIALVAVVASYIPARRAAKVDPMVALRYE